MSLMVAQLVAPQLLTNADAVYYTASAAATGVSATTAKISRAVFINVDSSAHTVTAGIVPAGGSLTAGNTVINAISIPANSTYTSPELAGAVLPAGSTLHASAAANSVIIVMVSGLTVK